ncbi:hypothetical protein R8Z50_20520 [Longispora sp. K20-0274]|uniref:hypothetical protein n=1 Tax=Longispora sp. K20-0274 TaxID=3088255 RepID=UPI00399ADD0F
MMSRRVLLAVAVTSGILAIASLIALRLAEAPDWVVYTVVLTCIGAASGAAAIRKVGGR